MKNEFRQLVDSLDTGRVDCPSTSVEEFIEEPVPLKVFISDPGYLNSPVLSAKQLNLVACGTQIYFKETLKVLGMAICPYYKELVAMWGKGSGKDHCARIIIARIAYLLLCLKRPLAYYGLPDTSTIGFINMAKSAPQANNVFFVPLKRMIKSAPWFKDKADVKQTTIEFDKNLLAISGHSEMEQHEGYDLLVAVLDEIAAFKTDKECEIALKRSQRAPMASARAVYEGMRSSITSRFPKVGKLILISYTRFRGDFIWQRRHQGEAESRLAIKEGRPPPVFITCGATWEVNPLRKEEDFEEEFRRDPVQAAARYKCDPPLAEDAFFKDREKLLDEAVWRPNIINPVVDINESSPRLREEFRANHSNICGAHIDLSLRHDFCGVSVCHQSGWKERLTASACGITNKMDEPVVEVDLICRFMAPCAGVEIDIEEVLNIIYQMLSRGFNIKLVTMDGYQSAQAIQGFIKAGIEAKTRSMDKEIAPWNNLKDLIYGKRLLAYHHETVLEELEALTMIRANKVDHTDVSTKDEADALCGACMSAIELGCSGSMHHAFWSGGATGIFGSNTTKSPFAEGQQQFEESHVSGVSMEY